VFHGEPRLARIGTDARRRPAVVLPRQAVQRRRRPPLHPSGPADFPFIRRCASLLGHYQQRSAACLGKSGRGLRPRETLRQAPLMVRNYMECVHRARAGDGPDADDERSVTVLLWP